MLARHALGSAERSRHLEQMKFSGPDELDAFAAVAAGTGNKSMGAAVMSAMSGLKKKDRDQLVTRKEELSHELYGAEYAKAQEAITISKNRHQEALNRNREWESGRSNPALKIGAAMRKNLETGALDDDDGDDDQ